MVDEIVPIIDTYHCSICKENLPVSMLKKENIDYRKDQEGNVEVIQGRYSVWCGKCLHFRGIVDPLAQAELRKIEERK